MRINTISLQFSTTTVTQSFFFFVLRVLHNIEKVDKIINNHPVIVVESNPIIIINRHNRETKITTVSIALVLCTVPETMLTPFCWETLCSNFTRYIIV